MIFTQTERYYPTRIKVLIVVMALIGIVACGSVIMSEKATHSSLVFLGFMAGLGTFILAIFGDKQKVSKMSVDEALQRIKSEIETMSPEQLRAELYKHRSGELATALREAQVFVEEQQNAQAS